MIKIVQLHRLTARKLGGRKRALGTRAPTTVPRPPTIWSIDFVQDALDDGWRFRILNVDGDFTRECSPACSIRHCRVSGCA
jgi:putative transposase